MQFQVSDSARMVTVVSTTYVCPRCEIFCMERKALFPRGGAARYVHQHKTLPECKVFCKNGCHQHPKWGWWDITDPRLKGKHIPRSLFA